MTKTYDGGLTASGTGTVSGDPGTLGTGDVVALGSQAFTDKNQGTGKTVGASGVTIGDGSNDMTGNYTISYTNNVGLVYTTEAYVDTASVDTSRYGIVQTNTLTGTASGDPFPLGTGYSCSFCSYSVTAQYHLPVMTFVSSGFTL